MSVGQRAETCSSIRRSTGDVRDRLITALRKCPMGSDATMWQIKRTALLMVACATEPVGSKCA